jgi:septal ring factor EnvC (AmiA/AmiB activator)
MEFLGIGLTKGTYIVFTWVLIFALLIAVLVLYFRFNSANKITLQTRKEYASLQSEFEGHRQRARETETKLKRDLQTEINRIEEMKGTSGSKS